MPATVHGNLAEPGSSKGPEALDSEDPHWSHLASHTTHSQQITTVLTPKADYQTTSLDAQHMTRLSPQDVPGRQRPWILCAFAGALIPTHSTQAYVYEPPWALVSSSTQMTKESMSQDGQTQGGRLDLPALLPVPNRKTLRTFHAPLSEWSFAAAALAGCGRERTGAPAAAGDAPHAGCGNAVRPKAAATSTMDGQRAGTHTPQTPQTPSIPSPTNSNPPRSIPQTIFRLCGHCTARTRQPLQC